MAGRCSANPRSEREPPPRWASTINLDSSSSKSFVKTYSKRSLQHTSQPCKKRQRVDNSSRVVANTANSGLLPSTPTIPKKRSISEYFKPVAHTRSSLSPQSSTFSSDPIQKHVNTPPSSPPLRHISPSQPLPKARKRRRLTTRIPLGVIMMSDLNGGTSKDDASEGRGDKGKHRVEKGPFYPGSPGRQSYLDKSSSPGRRQAARGGTSSEEGEEEEEEEGGDDGLVQVAYTKDDILHSDPIDITGARINQPERLYIPFAPQRPYNFRGSGPRQSNDPITPQMNPFSSTDASVGRSDTSSNMANRGATSSAALLSFGRDTTSTNENPEETVRIEILHATQSSEQDLALNTGVERNTIFHASRAGAVSTGNHTHLASSLVNAEDPAQSHGAGPSDVQGAANSVPDGVQSNRVSSSGIMLSNTATSSNTAQSPGNLVQTQLALGNATNTTCNTCRFVFNRTVAADVAAHHQYHDAHVLGEPVTGLTPTSRYILQTIDTGIGQGDYVILVDSTSTQGWKNLATAVLERHVDMELGAIPIDPSRLWSLIQEPATQVDTTLPSKVNRFQIYMYVRRHQPKLGRVVSLLLAERITSGCETRFNQIERDEFGPWPSVVPRFETVVSSVAHEAVLGVNKFWTARNSRHMGFAKILLHHARQNLIRLYIIPRTHIAWTHTTEDGAKFAKKYLEDQAPYDFLTYDDLE